MHGKDVPTHLGRRVLLGTADVGGDHLGALPDEDLDRRLGHPRTGAGDHGHLPVQLAHHVTSGGGLFDRSTRLTT